MPSAKKIALKEDYSRILSEKKDFVLTRFSGLDVSQMSDIRKQLREKNIDYRVVKNNIFKIALKEREDLTDFPVEETFAGPFGIAFTDSDMPVMAKLLRDFAKENENFDIVSGVMESKFYDQAGIQGIASLPSREESLATLASALQSPARNIASLMNQIMSSLARAVRAVGEKNG